MGHEGGGETPLCMHAYSIVFDRTSTGDRTDDMRLPVNCEQPGQQPQMQQQQQQQHPAEKRQRLGDPGLLPGVPQWQPAAMGGQKHQQGQERRMMPPPAWAGQGQRPVGGHGAVGEGGGHAGGQIRGGAPTIPIPRTLAPPPMFLAAGGMDVLVDMMQNSDPEHQQQAAQVVFEACTDNPQNQQLVNDAGGVHTMVQLLQTGAPEVKNKAAEAIAAACAQNRDNRLEALQANALEPLIKMLGAGNVRTQESAANALANVIIPREGDGMVPDDDDRGRQGKIDGNGNEVRDERKGKDGKEGYQEENKREKQEMTDGQNALNNLGGVTKLINLVETGAPRVKEAAAAAIANAMVDNRANRQAFQEAGGVGPLLGLLRSGDLLAQEHATTALWNAMVDNEETKNDLIKHPQGLQLLVQVLWSGTEATQESAAGTIWKACVSDPSIKDRLLIAIPGLVQLLRHGTPGGQTQAAGALRSALINSTANKAQLNRVGGIAALVSTHAYSVCASIHGHVCEHVCVYVHIRIHMRVNMVILFWQLVCKCNDKGTTFAHMLNIYVHTCIHSHTHTYLHGFSCCTRVGVQT